MSPATSCPDKRAPTLLGPNIAGIGRRLIQVSNPPKEVPVPKDVDAFDCRRKPAVTVTSTSGPPENKIGPGEPEKAVQQQATLSVAWLTRNPVNEAAID